MVHFGKTRPDELQIIVSGEDIESLRQLILGSSLMERRKFFGLKQYIEENFKNSY